ELALEHGDNWTDVDYCNAMYGNDRDGRFRSLKHWLTRRLIELQVSDVCLHTRDDVMKKYKARIRVNRYFVATYLYYSSPKGGRVLDFLFDQARREAEEFELYEELARIYSLMAFNLLTQDDHSKFEEYAQKKAHYLRAAIAVDLAFETYNRRVYLEYTQRNLPPHEELKLLEASLRKLRKLGEGLDSQMFNYFYRCLEYDYHLARRDIDSAMDTAKDLLRILLNGPLISSSTRIAKTYGYMSSCSLFLKDYKKTYDYAVKVREALDNFKSSNFKLAVMQQFFACVFMNKINQAEEHLKELLEDDFKTVSYQDSGKVDYFLAVLRFLQERYQESFTVLQGVKEIMDDKAGWNIGVRQLSFMCLVEMGLQDQASAVVEQMRKYLERTKDKVEFRERDQVIYSLFAAIHRSQYRFDHPRSGMKKLAAELADDTSPIAWTPVSQELVPVHNWFQKHLKKATSKPKKRSMKA
ncbi:MAG: hypothetical protein H6585_15730, partial [Flavobacteriales bacterium]|nr:hypothetical protein [Flavobacteriales bacterium]